MTPLKQPLTIPEIKALQDVHGYITVTVPVDLNDLLEGDLETFLDDLAEKAIGSIMFCDMAYKASGVTDEGQVLIEVTGDPADYLWAEDEEE